jgi:ADP-heptose:LPS heptosyltransferase
VLQGRLVDWSHHLKDFGDTAALIEQLDLVITVDTSNAHLSASLGKPIWVLSRYDACWRWLLKRNDSPWYRLARLFRQPKPFDWDTAVANVRQELISGILEV